VHVSSLSCVPARVDHYGEDTAQTVAPTTSGRWRGKCYASAMPVQTQRENAAKSRNAGDYSPQEAIATMAGHGYRVTAPRRAIIASALRQERPFTAEQLVAEAAVAAGESGRSTVYRTLEILASLGVLSRILDGSGRPVYVAGAPVHRHHLVCAGCGTAVPFNACPVADLAATLARENDFEVHGHLLEIFGTCGNCRTSAG
jgi:Fur family transcriptional regulator, ferric uptake regulator